MDQELACGGIIGVNGSARFGSVRLGSARFGSVRLGSARFGSFRLASPVFRVAERRQLAACDAGSDGHLVVETAFEFSRKHAAENIKGRAADRQTAAVI